MPEEQFGLQFPLDRQQGVLPAISTGKKLAASHDRLPIEAILRNAKSVPTTEKGPIGLLSDLHFEIFNYAVAIETADEMPEVRPLVLQHTGFPTVRLVVRDKRIYEKLCCQKSFVYLKASS